MKILLVSLFVLLVILAGQQAFASQAGLDPLQAKITQGDSGVSIKAIAFDPGEGEWLELQIYPPSGKTFSADDSNKITILDGSGAKISLLFDNLRGSTVFRAKLSQPFESNYRGSASYPVTVKVSSGALTGEYVISATLVGKYGQGAFFNGGLVVNAAGQNPIPNPQPNTGNSMQEKAGDSNIVTLKVSIQPRKDIKVKETVKISAQVKNLGSKAGTKTIDGKITWYSEGKSKSIQLSSQKVKLGPGEQTFLDWDGIKLTSGGSYDIIIGEGSLQFSVKEIKKTSEKKETEKKESIKRDEKPKEDKKKREPAKETEKKKQSSGTDKKPTKQLLAPGKVHGIVVLLEKDGTTAAPLPYITVTLKDSSGTRKELTDHDGRYEFKNVVPGPVSVSISLPQGVEVANDDTHEIVVEPGSTNTSDFGVYYQKSSVSVKMQPAEVHGSVYLAEKDGGKAPPLRNLTVTLQDGSGTRTEQTDANGEYEFKNVVPGPVFVSISVPLGTTTENGDTHALMVEPGSTNASHFLVNYAKNPFRSVKTQPAEIHGEAILALKKGQDAAPLRNLTVTLQDGSGTRTEQTDDNGRYEFKNVVPGPVFVSISVPLGTATEDGDTHALMVEPGSTNASHFLVYYAKNPFGSVKLQPGKISGTVSMTATSGNAGPVKDITVIVQDASGTKMIKTDKNGRFEFSNVVPGPVFVSIDVPELTSTVDGDKHAIYVEPGRSYTSDFGINKLGLNVDQ